MLSSGYAVVRFEVASTVSWVDSGWDGRLRLREDASIVVGINEACETKDEVGVGGSCPG